MTRNLYRRIEVAFPIFDKALKKRVMSEGLEPYLKDNCMAWLLDESGNYERRHPRAKQENFAAQDYLMNLLGTPSE